MTVAVKTGIYVPREDIERRAAGLRKDCGLNEAPIDPVIVARRLQVPVFPALFADDSISGILKMGMPAKYAILVNQNHPITRQRFTIAHEVGHFVLHGPEVDVIDTEIDLYRGGPDFDDVPSKRRQEIQANLFAAALLMPEELVRNAFPDTGTIDELSELFAVSPAAMGIRLAALDLG